MMMAAGISKGIESRKESGGWDYAEIVHSRKLRGMC